MFKEIAVSSREKTIIPVEEFEEFRDHRNRRGKDSLFSLVISEPELSLDFVKMALIVQPFDDIIGSGLPKIFLFLQNRIRLLVRELSFIWERTRERIERFLRKWCEWRFPVWTHSYSLIRGHDR
ncbi:hypothetical protein V5735_23855 (plasmid) [Haladaptatus sp. SPP-AMP-3]|uniref:hypothetical protein n=1 Tax=Haladaptatus sp. SPP-AMP-3 TaxID=3121295 RepID=UPI003C2AB844